MMKKAYIKPEMLVTVLQMARLVCISAAGVKGTGNMSYSVSNEETSEYLSRRSNSPWDEE